MQQWRPESAAMTFDEVSMERSKSFVNALQELKNLRPQLYSAAEYCEKSYFHSEQKQMVLDNLKDYAVRVLVNAVDHLGTVACKLTDLFEQQASEVSYLDLKVTCLNQQLFTCQTYIDKEGLRQQQMLGTTPRYHKHYLLPYVKQDGIEAKPRPYPSGPSAKTLSWHLASENPSTSSGTPQSTPGLQESKTSQVASDVFHLLGTEEAAPLPWSRHVQVTNGSKVNSGVTQMIGIKDVSEMTKSLPAFRSFENPRRHQIQRAPIRTKNMLAALFVKHKSAKLKKISVA